ncbi:Repressible high-affinity phosphate permease [Lecanosticta acicola]|uniref:Repressible high-affinity phosphate permease n=1 Tax=Lecanosticta acicola TaxID=111012 RepID=A0AAI9E9Q7_9PEZI|nr:Repressible high-affinity phosphate permease [Lecanosticta acicola]
MGIDFHRSIAQKYGRTVAGSGFFTDSYNLFASNVILPALGYVYWADDENHNKASAFNLATLGASAVGQLVFGIFADIGGRRSLYGIELIIVIVSTVGLLQSSGGYSDGEHSTWDVTVWLIFWRAIMGLGIGAGIAAEWSSTKSRGRLMSAVFFMQPLGQLCAYGAGLTALRIFGTSPVEIDKLWRYVIGIGAFPTLLALGFRIYMPESGRYTFDVRRSIPKDDSYMANGRVSGTTGERDAVHDASWENFHLGELWTYIWREGHWIYLFGTCACWFLLDFAFYGMGFNNPSTLAKLWTNQDIQFSSNSPWWLNSSSIVNATIDGVAVVNGTVTAATMVDGVNYTAGSVAGPLIHPVLEANILHAIYTVSIASILGSILMIATINRFDRKDMLTVTFFAIGILLIIVASSFAALFHHESLYVLLIVFWAVISFLFSFGPNTLTFIIPAEVFPTKYRCSFYGIAAASGKSGALFVQIIISKVSQTGKPNSLRLRWLLQVRSTQGP